MKPSKLKLNEKQKRLSFLKFFLVDKNLRLQHWKFSNKKNFFIILLRVHTVHNVTRRIGIIEQHEDNLTKDVHRHR